MGIDHTCFLQEFRKRCFHPTWRELLFNISQKIEIGLLCYAITVFSRREQSITEIK